MNEDTRKTLNTISSVCYGVLYVFSGLAMIFPTATGVDISSLPKVGLCALFLTVGFFGDPYPRIP